MRELRCKADRGEWCADATLQEGVRTRVLQAIGRRQDLGAEDGDWIDLKLN